MPARIVVTADFSIGVYLSPSMASDLVPLLRQGGGQEHWPLQQRQTFNTVAAWLEEAMEAARLIEIRR